MQLASRVMRARRASVCQLCGKPVRVGDQIAKVGSTWQHIEHVIDRIRDHHGDEHQDK